MQTGRDLKVSNTLDRAIDRDAAPVEVPRASADMTFEVTTRPSSVVRPAQR